MSVLSREKVLVKNEVSEVLNEVNSKKVAKYTAIGVVGLSIAKVVADYSKIIDEVLFKVIPNLLSRSDFRLLNYLSVPNWFTAFIIISLIIVTIADYKIVKNKMDESKRAKFRGGM